MSTQVKGAVLLSRKEFVREEFGDARGALDERYGVVGLEVGSIAKEGGREFKRLQDRTVGANHAEDVRMVHRKLKCPVRSHR